MSIKKTIYLWIRYRVPHYVQISPNVSRPNVIIPIKNQKQPMQINPKNYLLLCIYIWYTSAQVHQGQCNHCTNSYKRLMQMNHEKYSLRWTNCRALSTQIILYQPKCIKNKAITLTEWWDDFWHYFETLHTCEQNPHFPFILFLC